MFSNIVFLWFPSVSLNFPGPPGCHRVFVFRKMVPRRCLRYVFLNEILCNIGFPWFLWVSLSFQGPPGPGGFPGLPLGFPGPLWAASGRAPISSSENGPRRTFSDIPLGFPRLLWAASGRAPISSSENGPRRTFSDTFWLFLGQEGFCPRAKV